MKGGLGEFSVWVGDEKVADKTRRFGIFPVFPKDGAVVEAVRTRLPRS